MSRQDRSKALSQLRRLLATAEIRNASHDYFTAKYLAETAGCKFQDVFDTGFIAHSTFYKQKELSEKTGYLRKRGRPSILLPDEEKRLEEIAETAKSQGTYLNGKQILEEVCTFSITSLLIFFCVEATKILQDRTLRGEDPPVLPPNFGHMWLTRHPKYKKPNPAQIP